MTPLPAELGGKGIFGWRLDNDQYAATWDTGEGAYRAGGRWNPKIRRAVYSSLSPSTAILEVAVHKGFRILDTVPHVLTSFTILEPSDIFVVMPGDVPNPNWLVPGIPSAGQQAFGNDLLNQHFFIAIPSTVSTHSWNLIFDPNRATGRFKMVSQERFALDTRLHPPA